MEVKYHRAQMWLVGLHRIAGRGASVVFPLHLSQLGYWSVGVMELHRL